MIDEGMLLNPTCSSLSAELEYNTDRSIPNHNSISTTVESEMYMITNAIYFTKNFRVKLHILASGSI